MNRNLLQSNCIVICMSAVITFGTACNSLAVTQDEPGIASLTVQLNNLRQKVGKDHPEVIALQKKIGLLERLESGVQEAPEHQAIINTLTPMLIEEQQLLSKFGKAHPRIKAVRRRIEFTTKYLTDKLKKSAPKGTKKGDPNAAFLKLLPLLLKEQELIAQHGTAHSSVLRIQQDIKSARKNLAATSTSQRVPGRLAESLGDKYSPGIDNDTGKPDRYAIRSIDGITVLLDRETGEAWRLKIDGGKRQWIPLKRPKKKPDTGRAV